MIDAYTYQTVKKKRKKILANNPDILFTLLKQLYKKDQQIEFLEDELYGNT